MRIFGKKQAPPAMITPDHVLRIRALHRDVMAKDRYMDYLTERSATAMVDALNVRLGACRAASPNGDETAVPLHDHERHVMRKIRDDLRERASFCISGNAPWELRNLIRRAEDLAAELDVLAGRAAALAGR